MARDKQYAIAGLGVTQQGRIPGVSSIELRLESLRLAIADAGLSPKSIGGYIYQPGMVEMPQYCAAGDVPKLAGIAPNIVWQVQSGGTSGIAAIAAACAAIDMGACDYVAISYGDTALSSSLTVGAADFLNQTEFDTPGLYGMYSAGADHALAARRHMHEFGTTPEQFGAVALGAREYAGLRPDAFLHDRPLDMQTYLNAKYIAEPLRRHDYCLVADGSCTFIVTSAQRAADGAKRPVRIAGMGFNHSLAESFEGVAFRQSGRTASKAALAKAGLGLGDIDVAQIYDCFTISVLMTLEACGFCGLGEGGAFVEGGALRLDGAIPTNTAGGELAWGYLQGFTPIVEGIRQLRGEGGPTQVRDAQTCLVTGHGGTAKDAGYMEYADACMVLTT